MSRAKHFPDIMLIAILGKHLEIVFSLVEQALEC